MLSYRNGALAVVAAALSVVAGARAATIGGVQPLAWYKADAGLYTTATGLTASGDGGIVGRWEDQSGNNYHLRRNTGNNVNLPTLNSTGGPSSTPTVTFNAASSQYLLLSADGGGSTKQYLPDGQTIGSIFVVFKPANSTSAVSSNAALVNFDATGNGYQGVFLGSSTGLLTNEVITVRSKNVATGTTGANIAYGWTTTTGTVDSTSWTYLSANYNPTGHSGTTPSYDVRTSLYGSVLTNGWSGTSSGPISDYDSTTTRTASIQLGSSAGSAFLNGQISEVILFDHALNDTEMGTVASYLDAKYVPEPASAALLGLGVAALALRHRPAK